MPHTLITKFSASHKRPIRQEKDRWKRERPLRPKIPKERNELFNLLDYLIHEQIKAETESRTMRQRQPPGLSKESVEDDSETKNSDAQQDLPQRTFLDTNGIFGYMIKTSCQTARNLYHWIIRKKKNLLFIIPCAAFALAVIVGLTNDGTLLHVSSPDPDPGAPFWTLSSSGPRLQQPVKHTTFWNKQEPHNEHEPHHAHYAKTCPSLLLGTKPSPHTIQEKQHQQLPQRSDFNKSTQTMWVASFPDSLSEQILKTWVQGLLWTNNNNNNNNKNDPLVQAPVKTFYMQAKRKTTGDGPSFILRKCQSAISVTVLCTVVHPMVLMSPPPTAPQYTKYMHPTTLYVLRNPLSAIPAHLQAKAIKYHHLPATQQVSLAEWRSFRTQYLKGSVHSWKDQLRAWIPSSTNPNHYYRLGLVLPVEHVRHPVYGPQLLNRLRQILQDAGHVVVAAANDSPAVSSSSSSSIPPHKQVPSWLDCVWYSAIDQVPTSSSVLSSSSSPDDSYWQRIHFWDVSLEYLPPYTATELQWMQNELREFVQELTTTNDNDKSTSMNTLIQLLQSYIQDIQEYPVVEPESNSTTTTTKKGSKEQDTKSGSHNS